MSQIGRGLSLNRSPLSNQISERECDKEWSKRPSLQRKDARLRAHVEVVVGEVQQITGTGLSPDRVMSSEHSHSQSARSGPVPETDPCNVGARVSEESKKEIEIGGRSSE